MSSPSTQPVISNRIGIYDPLHQATVWADYSFKVDGRVSSAASPMLLVNDGTENKVKTGIVSSFFRGLASFLLKTKFVTIF